MQNYIELMRIRYTDDVNISVESTRNLAAQLAIPPLLLIVFVENAFKHGVSYNHPSFIHIRIGYDDGHGDRHVISNSRHEKSRPGTTGIGLENVKKRLALIYQDNYTLSIDDSDPAVYTVKLVILHDAMLKCIAIDDEPLALRQLQGYIAKINFLKLEKAFTNAIEAQQFLAGKNADLIFVDINMPDLNGVDFVRALIRRPMIIFTTAYSEYAVEGFKLDAIDYLLKPFSFADFSRSAGKAHSLYELRHNQRPAHRKNPRRRCPKTRNTSP